MTVADDLVQAAVQADPARTRTLLRELDDPARRATLAALKKATTELRQSGRMWNHPDSYGTLGLAILGCTTGAAAVVSHLDRWWKWGPTQGIPIVDVLLDRNPAWLPDLVDRLAGQSPAEDLWNARWRVLEELRQRLQLPRPQTPYYVHGLVGELSPAGYRKEGDPVPEQLLAQVSADDQIVALLPMVLEVTDVPELFADTVYVFDPAARKREARPLAPEDTWSGVLRAMCAQGRLDRGASIDACLRILLRGTTTSHLTLLTALDPTPAEVAARRSYVQLAADGPGTSARYAQKALRAADDAGLLERATALDVGRVVLARPEKGLVTTQLGWLDRLAKQSPGSPDDVLLVVADAFGHERVDVQEKALGIVAKHLGRAAPATVAELVVAAAAVAPSVRARAAAVLGTEVSDPSDPATARAGEPSHAAAPYPVASPSPPWPAGPADVGALAETCAALIEAPDDPGLLEGTLTGLAALRNSDRAAFDRAMAPIRSRVTPQEASSDSLSGLSAELRMDSAQVTLLRVVLLDPGRQKGWRGLLARARHSHSLPDPAPSPTGVTVQRLREVASRVVAGEVGELVATPTEASGLLDPMVLVERVAAAEGAGRQPWPADLQQAFLRLPRQVSEEALARAGQLASPAGQALRRRLQDGPVDPVSTPVVAVVQGHRWLWPAHPPGDLPLVALDGPPAIATDLSSLAMGLREPHALAGHWSRHQVAAGMALWPLAMPAHREVLAAHALLALCDLPTAPGLPPGRALLAGLPAMDGPVGPAVALAVGYGLTASDAPDRTAAADAVIGLAERGADGAVVGRALLLIGRSGELLKLGRVSGCLADVLRTAPAAGAFVWALAAAALPELLERGARDTHRLLAVAADAAALARARGALDGLARVSQRGGSSRLVVEARRLEQVLAG